MTDATNEPLDRFEQMAQEAEAEAAAQQQIETGQELVEQSAPPEISTGELCGVLLKLGFSLVASRRGDHWELSRTEAEETGNAVGAVLDKYFPDLAQATGVEVTACLTVGAVVLSRLTIDKANDEKEVGPKQEKPAPAPAAQQPETPVSDNPEWLQQLDFSTQGAA